MKPLASCQMVLERVCSDNDFHLHCTNDNALPIHIQSASSVTKLDLINCKVMALIQLIHKILKYYLIAILIIHCLSVVTASLICHCLQFVNTLTAIDLQKKTVGVFATDNDKN